MFKVWIKIFEYWRNFFVDNGGEFDNEDFRDFYENLSMKIKTAATESAWSNGIVERHNAIIVEAVRKTKDDTKCSLDIAWRWVLNAKNSLTNVHGFNP